MAMVRNGIGEMLIEYINLFRFSYMNSFLNILIQILKRAGSDGMAIVILLRSFGLKWFCNVKITIFKVIFYLIYLFTLIKNCFCYRHS